MKCLKENYTYRQKDKWKKVTAMSSSYKAHCFLVTAF